MIDKTVTKPTNLDVGLLISEIDAAMTANVDNITDLGDDIKVLMDADFDAAQETILVDTVAAHPALSSYKTTHAENMSKSVQVFIYLKYDAQTQSSLESFYTRAVNGGGTPNRAAHIAAAVAWLDAVLVAFYAKKATIIAAADKAAVDAVTWAWETEYGPSGTETVDPEVTIENSLAITD